MASAKVHNDYLESIARVARFVDEHLEEELSVETLAEVALFSKYHFHRIFKGATGETLNDFVKRRRLEKAVRLLKYSPELSVTQVALQVGFNSHEHFSRSFKERFDLTPRQLKSSDGADPTSAKNSKIYQVLSDQSFYHIYLDSRDLPRQDFEAVLSDRPKTRIATISERFGEDGTKLVAAYQELIDWAQEQSWFSEDAPRFAFSRDDVEVTPAEQYQLEFGIAVPESVEECGRISMQSLVHGLYVLVRVQGDIHRVAQAWDYLYKHWLPTSGFRPANQPAIEIFLQGPEKIGWELFDLEIGFPVEKLPVS